jgi:membrane protease subunit HflK
MSKSPWEDDDSTSSKENIFTKSRKKNTDPWTLLNDWNFNFNYNTIKVVIAAIFSIWILSGIYEVKEGEEAVIVRFGKFVRKGTAGLNYSMPYPIESRIIEKVNQSRRIEIGYRSSNGSKYKSQDQNYSSSDFIAESIMLTGDENIIYLHCDVMWHINNLEHYIFNVVSPEDTVKTASESAIREIIGQTPIASVLSSQKQEIADKIASLTQKILEQYKIGVEIDQVQLLKAEPPAEVIDAYRDVQTSRADKEREINQAQAYNNDILPKARGEAAKILQEAEGYKQEIISKATGDASRFNSIYNQYILNPKVMKERLQLDAITEIMKGSKKVITNGVLPHMSIDKIQKAE